MSIPERVFIDSCTIQALGDYGEYIYDGGPIEASNRIFSVPDGISNIEALKKIIQVGQRVNFQWFVSRNSEREALGKDDASHWAWFYDLADYSRNCMEETGLQGTGGGVADELNSTKFGYLSVKDSVLIQDAVNLECDAFLTMERRLPKNAGHLQRELNIQVLTPIMYWNLLRPFGALWY